MSFRVDEATGVPLPAGAVAGVPTPVCVQFLVGAPDLAQLSTDQAWGGLPEKPLEQRVAADFLVCGDPRGSVMPR